MELKFVIPNMEKTFGNLEFAGEDKTEQRRINGRMAVLSRSFNLYSDVQRADDIVVILPAEAEEKHFDLPPCSLSSCWLSCCFIQGRLLEPTGRKCPSPR